MSIRIGIPNLDIYEPIIARFNEFKEKYDLQLFRDEDSRIADLFAMKKLDLVFLTPIGYGKGLGIADYRIIPHTCLAFENYTASISLFFNQNANRFKTLAAKSENDYITIAARIILAERYDTFPEVIEVKDGLENMLKTCDTAAVWHGSAGNDLALDISEQWFDTYEFPLPIGFWVCRAEDYPENIIEIVSSIAELDLNAEQAITEIHTLPDSDFYREGIIHYRWSDDIEQALFDTIQILFVLQIFNDVPAIKLLGRD